MRSRRPSTLRKARVRATSNAMATAVRTIVLEDVPARPSRPTPPPQGGRTGARNRRRRSTDEVDAIGVVHDHCAVYTGPEAVEVLLDLVGWKSADISVEARLLEPACGDGSFLLPAIERLLEWADTQQTSNLEPMIRAYEFESRTVETLRRSVVALLRANGRSAKQATRLAAAWVRCEDFLLAEDGGGYTHAVGNPPYMRWSLVPAELRTAYEKALPKVAARGDLCLAFLWKASQLADASGSRIGFLCADRWLRCAYGQGVRADFARTHVLRAHLEVHGLPVFKGARKVGAYAAVTVLERCGDGATPVVGKATSLEHLSKLAKSVGKPAKKAPAIWSPRANGGARLGASNERELMEVLQDHGRPLAEVGVTVRCGLALGLANAFVVGADIGLEPEHLLPYLRSRDLDDVGGTSSRTWVVNVWTEEGTLIDLTSAPLLARHLEAFRPELEKRACVVGDADWYRTIDKFHASRIAEPKILVAGMARRGKIASDPGGHVVSNASYCLTSAHWPLQALAGALRAGVLDLFGEMLSPRFSGGTKRYDGNVLRQVQLPAWESVPPAVRGRIERRDRKDGFDATLVADLFGVPNASQRTTLRRILDGIDGATGPVGGAR